MHCPSVDSVFLRANGNIVCWDDAGSDLVLHGYNADTNGPYPHWDTYPGELIARKLNDQSLPFPEICPGCFCLSLGNSSGYNRKIINVMQVEPSSKCSLECKACATPEERMRLDSPDTLTPVVFERILKDLVSKTIDIRSFDFSGHGEPLMNLDLWQLIRLAREYYPSAFISMITNAHGNFSQDQVSSGLNQIQFSIDGTNQENYEKYRVGGNHSKALKYMKSFAEASGSSVRTIWRYILFNHNDDPSQLDLAYKTARKLGINELRFIFTHKGMWSTKLTSKIELRDCLLALAIPKKNIKVDSLSSLKGRQKLGQFLKRNPILYGMIRRLWQKARSSSNLDTIVTTDFYQLDEKEMQETIDLGWELYYKGKRQEAYAISKHVSSLLHSPVAHNDTYDPASYFEKILNSSIELDTALDSIPLNEPG